MTTDNAAETKAAEASADPAIIADDEDVEGHARRKEGRDTVDGDSGEKGDRAPRGSGQNHSETIVAWSSVTQS